MKFSLEQLCSPPISSSVLFMKQSISIEPVFKHSKDLLSWFDLKSEYVVQGSLFKLGLKIINNGKCPIKNISIKNIQVRPIEKPSIVHDFRKEYQIDLMNPGDERTIWVSDFGTDTFGLTKINLTLVPDSDSQAVEASQVNRFNSEEEGAFTNEWLDFFYVKSSHEHAQEITNSLLLFVGFSALVISYAEFLYEPLLNVTDKIIASIL